MSQVLTTDKETAELGPPTRRLRGDLRCWISRAWSLGEPRGYDDGRRAARVVVPMRCAPACSLAARYARVELCPRCDLGVRHHLGPPWAEVGWC